MLAVLLLFGMLALLASALSGVWSRAIANLPSLDNEAEYHPPEDTLIFDGSPQPQLIAVLNGGESRIIVTPEQIPEQMKQAIVVIEDDRFYEHNGVDPIGMARALLSNFSEGRLVEGGSTITQQYIKNAYVSDEPTVQRKLKEALYAWQLEQKWPKDRILTEYLNTIYFGNGAYGLQMAALTYFNKPVSSLNLAECALLAALPKSPSDYSPFTQPQAAHDRRELVLAKLLNHGMISQEDYDQAVDAPLPAQPFTVGPKNNPAPYFIEYIKQQLINRYGEQKTYEGGLRVYTTLDLRLQADAEKSISSVLDQPGDPSAALVCLEPRTSYVRAMVGGLDFSQQQFNVATQGHRQPGSAFKPFVLATALNKGISINTPFISAPQHIYLGGTSYWDVVNFDSLYLGRIDLQKATVYSDNAVYAQLMMKVGPNDVADTAHKAGIKTQFTPQPAIALGGLDNGVSPLEMASAYGTFATDGQKVNGTVDFLSDGGDPVSISRVTDSHGNVLDENKPAAVQTLDPVVSYYVNQVLEQVAMHGTGQWSNIGRIAAGKSGTTEDHVDAWFSGYTPNLVTTVWIGYPGQRTPMTDVRGNRVTGGAWPAEIWHEFMTSALEDVDPMDFLKPPNSDLVRVQVCSDTGQIAWPWCPHKEIRGFLPGHVPTEKCTTHKAQTINMPAITGMKLADAWKVLTAAGLQGEIGYWNDRSKPADLVMDQGPKAGEKVIQGTKVTVIVAGSAGQVAPPPDDSMQALQGQSSNNH